MMIKRAYACAHEHMHMSRLIQLQSLVQRLPPIRVGSDAHRSGSMVFGAGQAGPSPRTGPRAGRRSMLPRGGMVFGGVSGPTRTSSSATAGAELLLFPIQ